MNNQQVCIDGELKNWPSASGAPPNAPTGIVPAVRLNRSAIVATVLAAFAAPASFATVAEAPAKEKELEEARARAKECEEQIPIAAKTAYRLEAKHQDRRLHSAMAGNPYEPRGDDGRSFDSEKATKFAEFTRARDEEIKRHHEQIAELAGWERSLPSLHERVFRLELEVGGLRARDQVLAPLRAELAEAEQRATAATEAVAKAQAAATEAHGAYDSSDAAFKRVQAADEAAKRTALDAELADRKLAQLRASFDERCRMAIGAARLAPVKQARERAAAVVAAVGSRLPRLVEIRRQFDSELAQALEAAAPLVGQVKESLSAAAMYGLDASAVFAEDPFFSGAFDEEAVHELVSLHIRLEAGASLCAGGFSANVKTVRAGALEGLRAASGEAPKKTTTRGRA